MERKKNIPAFIRNIYQMLQREELKDTVSWQQKQNGFVIKKLDAFTNEVLPQYFKHKKYQSFVRQLNMYGFHKQRSKENIHSYGHQFFKKGVLESKDRLLFMQVLKRKPEKKKKVSSEVKNGLQDNHQKQQRSLSEDQSQQNQSVSISLQDQKECANSSQPNIHSQSRYGRKQSFREERRMSKTESMNIFPTDQDENQYESSNPPQSKLEAIIIEQNTILRRVHSTIREQLLKCKQMMKNKAMDLGSILNNGEPIVCALRLANSLNQQTSALRKLVELSSQYQDTGE